MNNINNLNKNHWLCLCRTAFFVFITLSDPFFATEFENLFVGVRNDLDSF